MNRGQKSGLARAFLDPSQYTLGFRVEGVEGQIYPSSKGPEGLG